MVRKRWLLLGLALMLNATLAACSGGQLRLRIPKRCDQIVDEYFLTIPLGTPPSEVLEQRVVEGYGLSPGELWIGEGTLAWQRDDSFYAIRHTQTGGVLAQRSWKRDRSWPIAEEVLGCFGNPTMYDAYVIQDITPMFVLQLWYMDRGDRSFLVEGGYVIGTDLALVRAEYTNVPTQYDGSIPINVVYTGDMTYLLSSPLAKLKPWPGRAEDIVIEQMRTVNP
jgi:hypothetical protein